MASKTLYYKQAQLHEDISTRTLQSMLVSAFKKRNVAMTRRQEVDSDGKSFRLIHYHSSYKGFLVGEMLEYIPDHKQPMILLDETADTIDLQTYNPAETGANSQFVQSILYFGIKNNHVVIGQSASLKALQFESYLNWILHETQMLTGEQFLALVDQPPLDKRKKIAATAGITFTAPLNFEANEQSNDGTETLSTPSHKKESSRSNVTSVTLKPKGEMFQAIKNFLPKEFAFPSEINVEDFAANRGLILKQANACLSEPHFCSAAVTEPAGLV